MCVSFLKHKTLHVAPLTLNFPVHPEQIGVKYWDTSVLTYHRLYSTSSAHSVSSRPEGGYFWKMACFHTAEEERSFNLLQMVELFVVMSKHLTNKYTTHRGIKCCTQTLSAAEQPGNMEAFLPRSLSCFGVCNNVLSVFSLRFLQGEKSEWESWLPAWMHAALDNMWGTWGNHPARQQLTHKQINQCTPGLSHLPASHVERVGPPCPNSLSYIHKVWGTRDKKREKWS